MDYPKADNNYFQERKGVLWVAEKVNEMRCIWRETPNADVGIDGQIELVDNTGQSTGRLVAVQVKSGPSYLKGNEENLIFYPGTKHRNYWQDFPIPVLIVIYDPQAQVAYWADARRFLRIPVDHAPAGVPIPRHQTFDSEHKAAIFSSTGSIDRPVLEVEKVPEVMASMRTGEPDCNLSFFDLFGFGIVDIGTRLFFSVHLCIEIAEIRAAWHGIGIGFGSTFDMFISAYVEFLVSQNLAFVDYSDFLIQWEERQLVPMFLVPLTRRGREVLRLMSSMAGAKGVFYEASLHFDDRFRWSLPTRIEIADSLQDQIRSPIKK